MSSSSGAHDARRRLVFGTAAVGLPYGLPRVGESAATLMPEEDARALIEHALRCGVDTFDTAPAYGVSEERLGRALGGRGNVWTKVTAGDPRVSLEASLKRLARDRVQLLQWHNWTGSLRRDAAWVDAWAALRKDVRVDRVGATTYGRADALAAVTSGLFDAVQVEFNVLNQVVVRTIAEAAKANGVRIAVRSVLLQGALTEEGRTLPDRSALREGVGRARALAQEAGLDLTTLALRAALDDAAIAHVLVGIDRAAQLQEAERIASGPRLSIDTTALDLGGDPACDPRTWTSSA